MYPSTMGNHAQWTRDLLSFVVFLPIETGAREMIAWPPVADSHSQPLDLFATLETSRDTAREPGGYRRHYIQAGTPKGNPLVRDPRNAVGRRGPKRQQVKGLSCSLATRLSVKSTESGNLGQNSTGKSTQSLALTLTLTLTLTLALTRQP